MLIGYRMHFEIYQKCSNHPADEYIFRKGTSGEISNYLRSFCLLKNRSFAHVESTREISIAFYITIKTLHIAKVRKKRALRGNNERTSVHPLNTALIFIILYS